MEQVDLTTPEIYPPPGPATNYWRVDDLRLIWSAKLIKIELLGQNGERKKFAYDEAAGAVTLMTFLNTANLSIKSLHRRIMERLISDGKLSGTISGTP